MGCAKAVPRTIVLLQWPLRRLMLPVVSSPVNWCVKTPCQPFTTEKSDSYVFDLAESKYAVRIA